MASNNTINIQGSTTGVIITGDNNNPYIGTIKIDSQAKELPFNKFPMPRPITTFHGRIKEMNNIDILYFNENQKNVVLHGLPGYGKSELSKQYAQRCLNNGKVDKIVWINAEKREELKKSYPELKQIYDQCTERCLFILDNGVCRRDITDYEPPGKDNFFILITSQEMNWGTDVIPVQVQPLEKEFAIEIFKSILQNKYDEKCKDLYVKLAATVDYVPLGLQVIGGYIQEQDLQNFNLAVYVQDIKQSKEGIINEKISRTIQNSYEKSIYNAMLVSLKKIIHHEQSKVKQLALDMLYICSYLNPDYISIDYLLNFDIIKEKTQHFVEDDIRRSLKLLVNYSFVYYEIGGSYVRLHRLTQKFLKNYLSQYDKQCEYFSSCLRYVVHEMKKCWNSNFTNTNTISVFSNGDNDEDCTNMILYYLKQQNCCYIFCICCSNTCILEKIFFCFVKSGCYNCLNKYFKQNCKFVNNYIISKYWLLNGAIYNKQINIVKLLLTHVYIKIIKNLNNLLYLAVESGQLEIIQYLIAKGANIHVKNNRYFENNSLFTLAKNKYSSQHVNWNEILTLFKFKKSEVNYDKETLLHFAAVGGHLMLIEILIANYGMKVNVQDIQGRTPLHALFYNTLSSYTNIFLILELFLKLGASLNIRDKSGKTARILILCYAVKYNDSKIFKCLLQDGTEVNETTKDHTNTTTTPLYVSFYDISPSNDEIILIFEELVKYKNCCKLLNDKNLLFMPIPEYCLLNYAVEYNNKQFLLWLIHHGVGSGLENKNKYHRVILNIAAANGNLEIMKIIIDSGVNVNSEDYNNKTALFCFVQWGNFKTININILNDVLDTLYYKNYAHKVNDEGDSLLHVAIKKDCAELVTLLIDKYQFDVNTVNKYTGDTPLHIIISHVVPDDGLLCTEEIVKILLRGAKLDIVNRDKKTPLKILQSKVKCACGSYRERLMKIKHYLDESEFASAL